MTRVRRKIWDRHIWQEDLGQALSKHPWGHLGQAHLGTGTMCSQVPSEASHSRKRVPQTPQRIVALRFEARIRIVPVLNCPCPELPPHFDVLEELIRIRFYGSYDRGRLIRDWGACADSCDIVKS